MSYSQWQKEISEELELTLESLLPNHKFKEVIKYSVFPTGKLFRPLLVYSLAKDLGEITKDHKDLAKSIELHHTYTLIHDDLPSMDDDNERRGRASSHIQFSEWEAILAGDALLNLSYETLCNIAQNKLAPILKLYTHYTGANGLILGQIMDLGNENTNLSQILKLHELKTGRLIQLCLEGASILSNKEDIKKELNQLGLALGINFQLLDDLCELTEPINKHEQEINPFMHFDKSLLIDKIIKNNDIINEVCEKNSLNNLNAYIDVYHNKIFNKLSDGIENINKQINFQLEELNTIWK